MGAVFPWIIILPFLLLKENRNRRAIAVLIPAYATLALATLISCGTQAAIGGFAGLIRFPPVALGTVWLLSGRFSRSNRGVAFLQAFATLALIGLATGLAGRIGGGQLPVFVFGTIVVSLALVSALALGACFCRRKFKAVPFALWTAAPCYAFAFIAILLPALIMVASMGGEDLAWLIIPTLIATLFFSTLIGTILAGLLAAFIALSFRNSIYRERLFSIFRLDDPSKPPPLPRAEYGA